MLKVYKNSKKSNKPEPILDYHQMHASEANKIYKNIEKYKPTLSQETEDEILQYCIRTFGSTIYAPWLRVYSILNENFIEGWIPDNYYGEFVVAKFKGSHGRISDLSILHPMLFNQEYFPDRLFFANGIFFDQKLTAIPQKNIEKYLFSDCDQVIFKRDGSLQGLGVTILNKKNFDINKIIENGTFQTYVEQHTSLSKFLEGSVATVRITTVVDDTAQVSVRAAFLKLGREGDSWIKSVNHILVPINLSTGKLEKIGYDPEWNQHTFHPDSKVTFQNNEIPSFDLACDLAMKLQKNIPFVRCVGFDFAIGRDGNPITLEWNGGHNGIKFSEATTGPCFKGLNWEDLWKK